MKNRHFLQLLALLLPLLLAGGSANGQVIAPAPFISIAEGPLKAVTKKPDGTLLLTVMGVPVVANASTRLHSSTVVLTPDQLLGIDRMPGRLQRGLMGGTAIATGTTDANGILIATDVNINPAENVLVGLLTQNAGTAVAVNRMPVQPSMDIRLPGRQPMNAFAIPIDMTSVPVGTSATVEGYYDDQSIFRYTNLYVDSLTAPPISTAPQVSFILVKAVEQIPNTTKGDTLDVRGGVTFFHEPAALTQSIQFFRIDNGVATYLGGTLATRNAAAPSYGLFTFKATTTPSASPIYGKAPTIIRAVNISPGANNASTEDIVDVR